MAIFTKTQRLKIALGGLVTLAGFLVLVCIILTLTGSTNIAVVFQGWSGVAVALCLGTLDLVCGLLLVLTNKGIVLSLASHQEKAHSNAN